MGEPTYYVWTVYVCFIQMERIERNGIFSVEKIMVLMMCKITFNFLERKSRQVF